MFAVRALPPMTFHNNYSVPTTTVEVHGYAEVQPSSPSSSSSSSNSSEDDSSTESFSTVYKVEQSDDDEVCFTSEKLDTFSDTKN